MAVSHLFDKGIPFIFFKVYFHILMRLGFSHVVNSEINKKINKGLINGNLTPRQSQRAVPRLRTPPEMFYLYELFFHFLFNLFKIPLLVVHPGVLSQKRVR